LNGVLLDTDVLIEVLRGRDEALIARWYKLKIGSEPLLYTPVTSAELWHGIRPREESTIVQLLDALICVPVSDEIGRKAGSYLQRFHASHAVELGDAIIAATAAIHECALWTRNRKNYPMKDIELF
jgi:predicted nucleic acid-binding protein